MAKVVLTFFFNPDCSKEIINKGTGKILPREVIAVIERKVGRGFPVWPLGNG